LTLWIIGSPVAHVGISCRIAMPSVIRLGANLVIFM
jgi:hypothetical protein